MSGFKAKMQKKYDFRRAPLQSPLGSLQHSQDPLAEFKGPTSKGRERGEEDWKREVKGRGRGGATPNILA